MKYQIFGSEDSQDVDIMVFVDEMKSIKENHDLVKKLNHDFSSMYDKKINTNLAVLHNGMIISVFKGTLDECNNSLFYTYNNHQQKFPNAIERLYDRSYKSEYFYIKLKRISRFILSFFSREQELRHKVKPALKGDLIERLNVLELIDFKKYNTFDHKKESNVDIYKTLSFQFAQIFGLFGNKEIYSKSDAKLLFKPLSNMLDRKEMTENDYIILQNSLKIFINLCKIEIEIGRIKNLKEELNV